MLFELFVVIPLLWLWAGIVIRVWSDIFVQTLALLCVLWRFFRATCMIICMAVAFNFGKMK